MHLRLRLLCKVLENKPVPLWDCRHVVGLPLPVPSMRAGQTGWIWTSGLVLVLLFLISFIMSRILSPHEKQTINRCCCVLAVMGQNQNWLTPEPHSTSSPQIRDHLKAHFQLPGSSSATRFQFGFRRRKTRPAHHWTWPGWPWAVPLFIKLLGNLFTTLWSIYHKHYFCL